MKNKLPNIPSKVLEVALADLEAVEKMPDIQINMGTWADKLYGDSKCEVCHAGAVMINRLGAKLNGRDSYSYCPSNWPEETAEKLYFINFVRTGDIETAIECAERFVPFGKRDKIEELKEVFREKYEIEDNYSERGSIINYKNKQAYKDYVLLMIQFFKSEGL